MNPPNPPNKEDYLQLLDKMLNTDVHGKAASILEKAIGVRVAETEKNKNRFECSLSKSIKYNERCMNSLHEMGDNLLSVFVGVADYLKKRQSRKDLVTCDFTVMTGNMMNLMTEAVTISRRVSETAQGLHVTVDYLRAPKDLQRLDFSRSGRISIPHYSYNEASSMCLTWLNTRAEKLISVEQNSSRMNISDDLLKTTLSFKEALLDLKDSCLLSTQIFRVLMYCSAEGKNTLYEYINKLAPLQVNDIITELQTLRRQFDEITILLEKLAWGLVDLWNRCTGGNVKFEILLQETDKRLKPAAACFGISKSGGDNTPTGVKNLKSKINAGRASFENKGDMSPSCTKVPMKLANKKRFDIRDTEVADGEKYTKKLHQLFGTRYFKPTADKSKKSSKNRNPVSGACVFNDQCRFLDGSSEHNGELPDEKATTPPSPPDVIPHKSKGMGDGDGKRAKHLKCSKKSNALSDHATVPQHIHLSASETAASKSVSTIQFQQQMDGVTQMMLDPKAEGTRASFKKFVNGLK